VPRLRRSDLTAPGIARRRRGKGWQIIGPDGQTVRDEATLERIRALAVPPAWRDVWICPWPNGHIQATGIDARGRKQYRYHDAWRARRDQEKFDDMIAFARALPAFRRQVRKDLARPELDKEKVLGCAARLLDLGFFRIGSEDYAEQNESYGLATMRKEHVTIRGDVVVFDYIAKSGKRRVQSIADAAVLDVVGRLKRRRTGGPELLAYRTEDGGWADIRSDDINRYIKAVTSAHFSAKDFRTWNATVLAAAGLAELGRKATTRTARKRAVVAAVRLVAEYLGNTPAVCRSSYIDPRVIDRFESGWTIGAALDEAGGPSALGEPGRRDTIEAAVLDLLCDEETPLLEQVA
jgi:DNA topoisomerase IB